MRCTTTSLPFFFFFLDSSSASSRSFTIDVAIVVRTCFSSITGAQINWSLDPPPLVEFHSVLLQLFTLSPLRLFRSTYPAPTQRHWHSVHIPTTLVYSLGDLSLKSVPSRRHSFGARQIVSCGRGNVRQEDIDPSFKGSSNQRPCCSLLPSTPSSSTFQARR
ncbi:hypothetical protein VTK26DRAFT_3567 [Humicola hyalothermophila]